MGNLKCICIPASSPKHQRCGNSSWESNFYQGVLIPPSLADNQFRHIQNNSNIQQLICQPLRISRFGNLFKMLQNVRLVNSEKKTPSWTRSHRICQLPNRRPSQAFDREAVLNSNPEMPVQMVLFDSQNGLSKIIIRLIRLPIFSEFLPTDSLNPSPPHQYLYVYRTCNIEAILRSQCGLRALDFEAAKFNWKTQMVVVLFLPSRCCFQTLLLSDAMRDSVFNHGSASSALEWKRLQNRYMIWWSAEKWQVKLSIWWWPLDTLCAISLHSVIMGAVSRVCHIVENRFESCPFDPPRMTQTIQTKSSPHDSASSKSHCCVENWHGAERLGDETHESPQKRGKALNVEIQHQLL